MIALRNRLIFGIIKKIIVVFFTVIYKILALFNLQFTLLLLLVGLILFLTGAFENDVVLVIFYVLIVFSIVLAIIATIKKILGIGKKTKKSKGAQIIDTDETKQEETAEQTEQPVVAEQVVVPQQVQNVQSQVKPVQVQPVKPSVSVAPAVEKPVYYRVKQNPNYVMAEYTDRYELYKKTESGLVKVRVDKKH